MEHRCQHGAEEWNQSVPRQRMVVRTTLGNRRARFLQPGAQSGTRPCPRPVGVLAGGPVIKNRTFFFVDFEKVRDREPINFVASVPTLAERTGDFSQTVNPIFDPINCSPDCSTRTQVQSNGVLNVMPSTEIDKIGQAIINLYPQPNLPGEFFNFRKTTYRMARSISSISSSTMRFPIGIASTAGTAGCTINVTSPTILADSTPNDGITDAPLNVQNGSLEYTWTLNSKTIWTNHISVDRAAQRETTNIPSLTSVGLPSILEANGIDRMPTIQMSGAQPWTNLYDQCCLNTIFAHTLVSYSSQLVISKGAHLMKLGGEQRTFFNNFLQPPNPTGLFNFTDFVTSPFPNSNSDASGNPTGNPFASLLFGYPTTAASSISTRRCPPSPRRPASIFRTTGK